MTARSSSSATSTSSPWRNARPASCSLQDGTVTATGTYAGGFASEVYDRYGDVVELYVYTAPQTGYADGIQIADLSSEHPPAMGSGTWSVSVPLLSGQGPAASCVVAAQPTHNIQLAP